MHTHTTINSIIIYYYTYLIIHTKWNWHTLKHNTLTPPPPPPPPPQSVDCAHLDQHMAHPELQDYFFKLYKNNNNDNSQPGATASFSLNGVNELEMLLSLWASKMIQSCQISVQVSSEPVHGGVVELCSWPWLVFAVQQSQINERDLLGAGKYGRSKCVLSVENKLLYSPAAGPNDAWKTFSQPVSVVASLPIERQTGVCHLSRGGNLLFWLYKPTLWPWTSRLQTFYLSPHDTLAYGKASLFGNSSGVVHSLDFCLASLKSLGCFYFRCILSSQWKAVTVNFTLPTLKAFLEAHSHNVSGNKQ